MNKDETPNDKSVHILGIIKISPTHDTAVYLNVITYNTCTSQ